MVEKLGFTYEVLARKQPSHVLALARGEPEGTPILLKDCDGFEWCKPMYSAALVATPQYSQEESCA